VLKQNGMIERVLLFDGVCNLCNRLIRFIVRHDPSGRFKFASLQSEAGRQLLEGSGFAGQRPDSMVYLKKDRIYWKSDAVLELLYDLGSGWKLFYVFKAVPKILRDAMYGVVARSRYKIFGRTDSCPLPEPGQSSRFLDQDIRISPSPSLSPGK
jgi:predicted DCC family thiol-disulfide oxidoreductase YuxK